MMQGMATVADREHSPATEANTRLTSLAGLVLFVLLAVLGVTILRIHQLITAHIVLGLVLIGPLTVKVGSTGWRFVRYYAGDVDYGRAGPPRPVLRVLAPVVVITTIVVVASGVGLLAVRPGSGSTLVLVHKAGFVAWFAAMTVHVLAYVTPAVGWSLADVRRRDSPAVLATRRTRLLALAAGMLLGVVLGAVGLRWVHPWAAWLSASRGH